MHTHAYDILENFYKDDYLFHKLIAIAQLCFDFYCGWYLEVSLLFSRSKSQL